MSKPKEEYPWLKIKGTVTLPAVTLQRMNTLAKRLGRKITVEGRSSE